MNDPRHSANGLMVWLTEQFGAIQRTLGELHAQQMGNRHTVIETFRHLSHRMDRIEDRIIRNGNGRGRLSWLTHIPFVKITLLLMIGLLVVTGHLTVGEIKAYLVKRLLD